MYIGTDNKEKIRKERVQATIEMSNKLGAKFESLGIKRKSILLVAADLGDLYQYANDVRKHIELLLETSSSDWDRMAEIAVSLKVTLGEIKYHIADARKPLEYVADYCEDQVTKTNDSNKRV
jgi:hypothetical protein